METINWSDLFNLDDKAPIEESIKTINRFKTSYVDAIETAVEMNKVLGAQYEKIAADSKVLLSNLEKLNAGVIQNKEATMAAAKVAESLASEAAKNIKTTQDNAKAANDLSGAVKVLTDSETKLKKIKEDISKVEKDSQKNKLNEIGSINDLKTQLVSATKEYERMGEATEASVKESQIKRIKELSDQHIKAKKSLEDARKATVAAAGSYKELEMRVAESKKRLKEMSGGMDGNSKEFKKLKKEVREGTEDLKKWDAEIGDNSRSVGAYKDQIAQLIPGFSGIAGGLDKATTAARMFIATPIGAILALVAGALAAVAAWFTRTESGGDKLAEIIERVSAIFGVLLDALALVGEAIFNTFSEPQKMLKDFEEIMTDIWKNPMVYMEKFGNFLLDQIINRFLAFGKIGLAISKILSGEFSEGFKDLGNAALQSITGIENVIDKTVAAFDPLIKKMAEADKLAIELAAMKDKLEDQEVALILARAKTELDINKKLLDAKNKLKFTDEERFNLIQEVSKSSNKLLDQELQAAQLGIDIAKKEIEIRKLTLKDKDIPLDLLKAQNEAEAKLLDLKAKRLSEQKRLQQQEIAIIREIESEMITRIKREQDAERSLSKIRSDIRIKDLQDIQKDMRNEIEVRNNAIKEIAAQQQEQFRIDADKQLEASEEAALARVEIDAETWEKIYKNNQLTLAQRIELEREAKRELIMDDKAYVNERIRIEEDLEEKIVDSNQAMIDAVSDNVFKQLTIDFEELTSKVNTGTDELLVKLNESFAEGNMSLAQYEQQRENIQKSSQSQLLNDQLDYLQKKADALKESGQNTAKIDEEIAKVRLQISDKSLSDQLEVERQMVDAKKALQQQAFDTTMSFFQSGFEQEAMALEAHLQRLTEQKDLEIQLAGDNKDAIAKIENDFALRQKEVEAERVKNMRRQAQFEKAAAIFQIGVNTAVAISSKLPGLPVTAPLIAIIAALGALQIAAILAKPLPQFAEGTMYSPEGWAIVNELGPELIVDKQGNQRLIGTDGPTLTYLTEGSKIYKADDTDRMMNEAEFASQMLHGYKKDSASIGFTKKTTDRELLRGLSRKFDSLEQTIKGKKAVNFNERVIANAVREGIQWDQFKNQTYR